MNLALFLEAPIMIVPASPSQDFYTSVLESNFTSYSSGVGCLALDRDENRIVWLDRRTLQELDQKSFEEWLLRRLKKIVADLTLDRAMLQDVIKRKL